jgi:hypothetical protein
MLACLLVMAVSFSVQASAPWRDLFDAQIQESTLRAEAMKDASEWLPGKLGNIAARAIHLQKGEEAWAFYQDVYQQASAITEFELTLKAAALLWRLWQAENHLRWIYLRDTAMGLMLIGKVIMIAGWVFIGLWKKRIISEGQQQDRSGRLSVAPDQPLDFRVPLVPDPKETRLYQQAEKLGFLSPLAEKILACFSASPDHPASIQDHLNVTGGLIEHTARTIHAITQIAEGRPDDEKRLCYLMALCHDLGKLFAYERAEGQWVDRRLPHDRLSALMVASLPELYTELSLTQREALILAVRYYHNPEELPTMAPPMCYMLFEQMHKADATAYEQEKELGRQQVEGIKPHLWEAFCTALPQLNINRHRGGYPEGFTAGEIIFILEHALREKTLDQLPPELQQRLPIRRPSGRLHPAWPLLVDVLKEKNLLVEQVKGRKTNPSALFNIRASGTTYKCVVALSLDALAKQFPEAVAQWQQCPPYEVQIAGGRYGD